MRLDRRRPAPSSSWHDGGEVEDPRWCSPLTISAVANLLGLRAGAFVVVLGAPDSERIAYAARSVGATGRIVIVAPRGDRVTTPIVNVLAVVGTFEAIPLLAGCADLLTSCCAIHRACNPRVVYDEIHRVLKPDGRFVISDVVVEHSTFEERASGEVTQPCRRRAFATESTYIAEVRRAGFRDVEILQRTAPYDLDGALATSMVLSGTRGDGCPSRSHVHGWRCAGRAGHAGLHHAEICGHAHAWTDETSPELSIDLCRHK